jgi:membrane protein
MVLPGRDIPWKTFLGDLKNEWMADDLLNVGGSVTFFMILALFPFLMFLVALAGVFIDPKTAESLIDQLAQVAPEAVTQILGDRLRALSTQNNVGLVTLGALAAIWSASGGITSVMAALNTCYGVKEGRPFWKYRSIAVGLTLFTAAFALISALVAVAVPPIADAIGGAIGTAISWLRIPIAALLMMFLWAVLYYMLPDVEQQFRFITPGSVVGVILWAIASWGFSQYVSHFGNYEVTYGALGGVAVLLLWMWISSLVFLLGAEINAVIEARSPEGKKVGAKRMLDVGRDQPKTEKQEEELDRLRQPPRRPRPPVTTVVARTAKNTGEAVALKTLFGIGKKPTIH